jgi:hypothetical protein
LYASFKLIQDFHYIKTKKLFLAAQALKLVSCTAPLAKTTNPVAFPALLRKARLFTL